MSWRSLVRRNLWLRPLALVLLVGGWIASERQTVDVLAPTRSVAVAEVAAARGLYCTGSDVFWIRGPTARGGVRVQRTRGRTCARAFGSQRSLHGGRAALAGGCAARARTRLEPDAVVERRRGVRGIVTGDSWCTSRRPAILQVHVASICEAATSMCTPISRACRSGSRRLRTCSRPGRPPASSTRPSRSIRWPARSISLCARMEWSMSSRMGDMS